MKPENAVHSQLGGEFEEGGMGKGRFCWSFRVLESVWGRSLPVLGASVTHRERRDVFSKGFPYPAAPRPREHQGRAVFTNLAGEAFRVSRSA